MRQLAATHLLLLALSYFAVFTAASAAACEFPAVFNFGDSNSDTGGLSAAFGQAPAPNGETFFGRPAGRYCDGRLIVDFIAESLGLSYLNAYLDSVGANFSRGVNFATAGSTVRRQNSTLFQSGFSPFSLDVQSWQFSQFKARSQFARLQDNAPSWVSSSSSSSSETPSPLAGSVFRRLLPAETAFSSALYTFDIGMNDLTSSLFANQTIDQVKSTIPQILDEFSTVVKSVYGGGGRYFWVHNAGPIGCLAYVLERLPVKAEERDSVGCAEAYNALTKAFNERLKLAVAQLREALPDAVLTYVDVYAAKYSLFSHPPQGFTEQPLVACCGHGGKYNYSPEWGCGVEKEVNGTRVALGRSCADPSQRIVWDGVHYTEAANRWVFQHISSGAFSDPPLPLSMACARQPSVS